MGMCSSASSVKTNMEDICPVDEDHREIEEQYASHFNTTHPSNINQKYIHVISIRKGETSGRGIKITPSYDSRVSREALQKKRVEFWETRIEGEKDSWRALRLACECQDIHTTIEVLRTAGMKLINKSLQMSYDPRYLRYDLPMFLINEPVNYIEEKDISDTVERKELGALIVGQIYKAEPINH